jgi:hypothetical protein
MKDVMFKFEESLKQLHYKVDSMDQRLQLVEASIQSFMTIPKVEPVDLKQPSPQPPPQPMLSSSSEFKFQKFGTTTSMMSFSAVQSPLHFSFSQNENSNAPFVGGEHLISENSLGMHQLPPCENSKSIVKPDPDQHSNGGWSEYFGGQASFMNPSL